MKIGYKGLTADMTATQGFYKVENYEVGVIYAKENIKNPRLCSSEGYHYCNNLEDVFRFYKRDGKNRFFKIEILGNFTDDKDKASKSITTSFRIIEELTEEFFKKWDAEQAERDLIKNERIMADNLNLSTVKKIQEKYPIFHVGGSVGLFLHGIRLNRWLHSRGSDIDMVTPYFILPEFNNEENDTSNSLDEDFEDFGVDYLDAKMSGNDFDETFLVHGEFGTVKVDYKVDPIQRYEIVEYNGFKYKVSPLLTIVNAKMKYANNGDKKHKKDILEMLSKNIKK